MNKSEGTRLLTYSRDALAGPLSLLRRVYGDISAGRFLPDADRSGRWTSDAVVEAAPDSDVTDVAASSEHDSDQDVIDIELAAAEERMTPSVDQQILDDFLPAFPESGAVRHRTTMVIHALLENGEIKCSTVRGANHKILDDWPTIARPLCLRCWTRSDRAAGSADTPPSPDATSSGFAQVLAEAASGEVPAP